VSGSAIPLAIESYRWALLIVTQLWRFYEPRVDVPSPRGEMRPWPPLERPLTPRDQQSSALRPRDLPNATCSALRLFSSVHEPIRAFYFSNLATLGGDWAATVQWSSFRRQICSWNSDGPRSEYVPRTLAPKDGRGRRLPSEEIGHGRAHGCAR